MKNIGVKIKNKLLSVICLLTLITPNISLATECQIPVKYLPEGSISPCNGFLFSSDAEKTARQNTEDARHYKELTELQKSVIITQKEIITTVNDRLETTSSINRTLNTQLQQEKSFINKLIYVGVGGLVVFLIRK